ncbi:pyridoxal-phosphate dependent enzyme [Mesorhizobium sp. B2-2-4]|uniref:pyridoxal-phosphate dependent enzyme n=1 Tax=unclassified Mesorhizobium TaxID=325217 RepID=UPI00112E5EA5|nr:MULTISPECIES: pyridoxal-phosphate dependent enzyme [unclassified Mesorhizobium]MBZ9894633.1 pyridoxal-phosphate dependent enzyme [Mesorhizobium sp. BR1-1-6]TPM57432.1 pyridoxal-phosphate dependent enzyme [Mesorhizobium sp. B2-2-4]TPM65764.1 pyridoxal-phosphate dependent enzyme [Mesorhizobium sp. B2-2-1]TPN72090.1 pyridoxal-phosphate dependent enzyme [Mesorhizobium sp. B1-1-3]
MLSPIPSLNPRVIGLRCIRCRIVFPIADHFEGCPICLSQNLPASLAIEYQGLPKSLKRIDDWQVYSNYPTLGEGNTPLVRLEGLAKEIGVRALFLKNEGANPTGSHKDRMSRFVVQRALEIGASTVAAASSGNAGVSLAAYAAHVGLDCVIVTTPDISPNWRHAIEMHGATLLASETAQGRWQVLADRVRAGEWYPATNFAVPPVGSNPFGVDGYRSLAFEIFLELGASACSDILVPTSRADLLWGVARGYCDLQAAGLVEERPRIHAVEPFGRISRVLAGEDYRGNFAGSSALTSIGGSTVTYQALDAIASCKGSAVAVDDMAARDDQKRLARCGFYLELSSAAALTGLKKLVPQGVISSDAAVVLVGTSSGFSDFQTFSSPIAAPEELAPFEAVPVAPPPSSSCTFI